MPRSSLPGWRELNIETALDRNHLPAAECFHPCSFFGGSGGDVVDGGVEEDGEAEGINVEGPGMDEAVRDVMSRWCR